MNDNRIVELLRTSKTDKAFQDLYGYFPAVKKLVLKNGGNSDDALDVYQEGLIILCKKVKDIDFKLTSSLNTYLYGVCKYIWKNELKKRKNKQYVELLPGQNPSIEADVDSYNESEKVSKLAEQAVLQLGEQCREILKLFYFDLWSMKKIAEKFGFASENVAKNQKYKCVETAKLNLQNLKKQHE